MTIVSTMMTMMMNMMMTDILQHLKCGGSVCNGDDIYRWNTDHKTIFKKHGCWVELTKRDNAYYKFMDALIEGKLTPYTPETTQQE